MGDASTEAALAQDLKVFRKQFRRDHGRDPSRKDMNKHPAIAATYDEWLALKSAQPRASASSSSTSTKRKALIQSPQQTNGRFSKVDDFASSSSSSLMAPPPTTPSKKRPRQNIVKEHSDLFKTPVKSNGSKGIQSPGETSIHDSGGSIIDVPQSPLPTLASPSLSRKQTSSKRSVVYESPTKIRDLLSSFSSIQRTPSKHTGRELNAELFGKLKGGVIPAYTPRTKARKRLRGEVVITPEKVPGNRTEAEEGSATNISVVQPAQKRRRGMEANTLRNYGITSIAGPRRKISEGGLAESLGKGKGAMSHNGINQHGDVQDEEGDVDDEEEEDMLGPSPSLNRIVDRPVKATKPLFKVQGNGILKDESELDEKATTEAVQSENAIQLKSNDKIRNDLDDEDRDIIVVPYQRYKQEKKIPQHKAFDSDDEGMNIYEAISAVAANGTASDTSSTPPRETSPLSPQAENPSLLDSLSLHSPQCKKARTKQRIKAEKSVRHLIGAEESLAILDEWDENENSITLRGGETESNREKLPKSNKVGPAIKGGKLMKSAQNFKSILSNGKAKEEKQSSSSLIFGNIREQLGSEEESDMANDNDDDYDEWASEVDSAEYGLGDGYMSDQHDD